MPSRRTILKGGAVAATALGGGSLFAGPAPAFEPTAPEAGQWPNSGYGPKNRAHNPHATGPTGEPSVDWETRLIGGFRSLVVEEETVYAARPGEVVALAADGERWRRRVGLPQDHGLAFLSLEGDHLYYLGRDGRAAAFDAASGERRWQAHEDGTRGHALLAHGGTVYCGMHGELVARDAASGDRLWRRPVAGSGRTAATLADGALYVGGPGLVYGFEPRRGPDALVLPGPARAWRSDGPGFCHAPVVAGDRVLVGGERLSPSEDRLALGAFDRDGQRVWRRELGHNVYAPAVADGRAFAAGVDLVAPDGSVRADGGRLAAFDLDDGTERWRYRTDTWPTRPVVAGGTVYVGERDSVGSRVHALDADRGDLAWTTSLGDHVADLAVVGETLYALSESGHVSAIR